MKSFIEKRVAAKAAISYLKNGMKVGLGSGSTSAIMVRELGKAVAQGLQIKGVPTSEDTAQLAQEMNIPIISLEEAITLDITIDGADEFDSALQLIKGGGGALLREKIVAHNSKYNIIIADSSKQVKRLGAFKLPIEVIPFAAASIAYTLNSMELRSAIRIHNDVCFKTDENNVIFDIDISGRGNLFGLEQELKAIPGIVETGLFLTSTNLILMGKGEELISFERTR